MACKQKEVYTVDQVTTQKEVTITNEKHFGIKDSFSLLIPIEYKFQFNDDNVHLINTYVYMDTIIPFSIPFTIYNSKNDKIVHNMVRTVLNGKYPKQLYIRHTCLFLSREETQKFIQKYAPTKSLQELEKGDTIVLASYPIFRKDNPKIIERLKSSQDSIMFSFFVRKDSTIFRKKYIVW